MKHQGPVFHSNFKSTPFWWEAYDPTHYPINEIPGSTSVAIIGAGYAGLSAALELGKHDVRCCVLDACAPGYNASTRSGGIVSGPGGIKTPLVSPELSENRYSETVSAANDALRLVETIITEESIDCEWHRGGFLKLACTDSHLRAMHAQQKQLSERSCMSSRVLEPSSIREGIGSDYFRGGVLTEQGGHLHPALYFRGLLRAAERREQISICSHAEVNTIRSAGSGWQLSTSRGDVTADHVIVASNGYTTDVTTQFKRRIVPIRAYIIATETLDDELANALSPLNCAYAESTRIAPFFRLSGKPGNRRLIFGSRVKWSDIEPETMAPLLFDIMIERFPQLREKKITHAWTGNVALTLDEQLHNGKLDGLYYALGCNGSGVANMTYLGLQTARKLLSSEQYNSPFDGEFPRSRFYNGNQRWFIPVIGNYLLTRDWLDKTIEKFKKP